MGSFGHTFRTRNSRKSTKGSKDSYYSLESKQLWATISARCLGDGFIKEKTRKSKTYPNPDDIHQTQTQISEVFYQSKLQDSTSLSRVWIAL